MNIILLFLLFICPLTSFGQGAIKLAKVETRKLPAGVNYEGNVESASRWTDSLGDNIVVLTQTGIYQSKKFKHENDGSDAELFAYHYTVKQNTVELTWKIYDFIKDCPVDIEASFIKNTFQVTDLNKDGISEVWIMYKTACHGDVSPCDMKIMMHQGQQKFAMRGKNRVKLSAKETYGGDYKFDKAFTDGPIEFREFAKRLWSKNIMQVWGE